MTLATILFALSILSVPGDFPQIQQAINAASDGDRIEVSPGTYVGSLSIDKGIYLVATEFDANDPRNNQTIIDGNGSSIVINIEPDIVTPIHIIGFQIRNGSSDGIQPRSPFLLQYSYLTDAGDLIDYERGSGGFCLNNVFEYAGDDAIDLDNSVVDLVIEGNLILYSDEDGIEIRLQDDEILEKAVITIKNNVIAQNGSDGVQIIDYDDLTNRLFLIHDNVFLNNIDASIGFMDKQDSSEDFRAASVLEEVRIYNNTFVGGNHGISGGDNALVVNNILSGQSVSLKNIDGDSLLGYNLVHEGIVLGTILDETHSFTDPQLRTADCGLEENSPAIDSGIQTFGPITVTSYTGVAPDLGWLEENENSFALLNCISGNTEPPPPPPSDPPAELTIDSITPSIWPKGETFFVSVLGSEIQGNVQIQLDGPSGPDPDVEIFMVANTEIILRVSVKSGGKPKPRSYSLTFTNPDGGSVTLNNAVTIQ